MVSAIDWLVFGTVLCLLLAIDLFSHRGSRVQSGKEAGAWSVLWIATGLFFTEYVWLRIGPEQAQEYIGAYLIEKSLSLDNLFLFLIIFQTLNVPAGLQPKALLYGIFGALFFRGVFIFAGIEAIERFNWIATLFGLLLFWAAYRIVRHDPRANKKSGIIEWLSRRFSVTADFQGSRFIARENGSVKVTPLLIAVIGLELTDILFAIDSIPAALSVSRSPFVIYSSNAFAILGLRSLYLAMHGLLERFRYLHYGLGGILAFAGVKLVLSDWIEIRAWVSVAVTVLILTVTILASPRERGGSANAREA